MDLQHTWIEGNFIKSVNKKYMDSVIQYLSIINNNLNQKNYINLKLQQHAFLIMIFSFKLIQDLIHLVK